MTAGARLDGPGSRTRAGLASELAAETGATPTQIALAALRAPFVTVPVIGCGTPRAGEKQHACASSRDSGRPAGRALGRLRLGDRRSQLTAPVAVVSPS